MKIIQGLPPIKAYYDSVVALDLEILGADPKQLHRPRGEFGCLSICPDGKTVYVVRKASDIPEALKRVRDGLWTFHNAGFDIRHLRRWAEIVPRPAEKFWDTLIMERLLWSGYYDDFGLDDLSRRYLQTRMGKDIRTKFYKATELDSEMIEYAAFDALQTWKIQEAQKKEIKFQPGAYKTWKEIDCPAFWAVLDLKGFMLDERQWIALAEENENKAQELREKLGFNPASWKQTQRALSAVGIHVDSTAEDVLKPYEESIPLVADILKYREAVKLSGTYGKDVVKYFLEEDNRIYCNYDVTKAKTGRMAADDPNMQQIPKDKRYRACFIAAKGNVLLIADYNQQEPRLTAQRTLDPALLQVFINGGDSHQAVADAIRRPRKIGKAINLGLVYGLTAWGLAEKTGITEHEADSLLRQYFFTFQGVERWMQEERRVAAERGYVETMGGRRMWLNLYSRQWLNHAVNTPIQGSAADVTKIALAELHKRYGKDLPIVAVVHDELVAECKKSDAKKVEKDIRECMTIAFQRIAPNISTLKLVDLHQGKSWADKG